MGQTEKRLPHLRRTDSRTQLIVDGQPFIALAGEVHNSSASSLEYMEGVWESLVAARCNTAIVPIYWELLEPEEGRFDFTLVDGILAGARKRSLRLILLWFGTWKNAMSTYAPAWVKRDLGRFPRAQVYPGVSTSAISALSEQARRADARAFAQLMRHLKLKDGDQNTVIMVQVENETGLLGGARDVSPPAELAYAAPVPRRLMGYLEEHRESLIPEFAALWAAAGGMLSGTWEEVFGDAAAEVFMAWHVAGYVDAVAAAGKAEHPLPMFVNTWLPGHPGAQPGTYPSGGPTARMMDVWRAAAPHVDALAPDIYLPTFAEVCAEYARAGNPLIIPEAHRDVAYANAFAAIAQHDALCFAPFGIDGMPDVSRLAESYELLSSMMPVIVEYQGSGRMAGIAQQTAAPLHFPLGGYDLQITVNRADPGEHPRGRGLVIALSDTEYLVAGAGFTIRWAPKPGDRRQVEFIAVDEGAYDHGVWKTRRRLNGDEASGAFLRLEDTLTACRVELHSFR